MNTVDAVYDWFWRTPSATLEDLSAALDAVQPLTCLRDSSGRFVRDANGVIVVVPLVTVREVKIANAA